MKKTVYTAAALALLFTGCAKYEPSPNMLTLNTQFADSKWDGKMIPKDEVCSKYNKNGGNTPSITINNLPANTNKIILTFSDNNPSSQMMNGGHGVVSYKLTKASSSVTIPSIKGETFDLPTNFKSERAHRATKWGYPAGAYLPPCSGGKGNLYSVKIEAIQEFSSDKKPMLLGETNLKIGNY